MKFRTVIRWFGGIALSIAISLGITTAKLAWNRSQAMQEVAAEVARLDESDPGWTFEAMDAKRKQIDPDKNGALCINEIAKLLPKDWPIWGQETTQRFGEPPIFVDEHEELKKAVGRRDPRIRLSEDAGKLLRSELARVAKALDKANELEKHSEGRFPIDYQLMWPATLVPDLANPRKVATVLELDVLEKSLQGDADGACVSAYRCALAGRFIGDEYTFISQLVRIAMATGAADTIEIALNSGEARKETLVRLQEVLEAEDRDLPGLIVNAARGERALTHRMMDAFCDGRLNFAEFRTRGERPDTSFMNEIDMYFGSAPLRRDHAGFLRNTSNKIEELANAKYPLIGPHAGPSGTKWYDGYVAAVSKVRISQARTQAFLRVTIVALAAEQYRQEKTLWPNALSQLVPRFLKEIPQDPFHDGPLKLAHKNDGIVIYSVGLDNRDDGGAFDWSNRFREGSDLGFRLWDHAKRGVLD